MGKATLGLNLGTTALGRALRDGAACLAYGGHVEFAVAEERLSRRKADGGFSYALPYVLGAAGAQASDIDMVVVSSCCEPPPAQERLTFLSDMGFRVVAAMPSHHLAHAYSSFYASPFERALVAVLDGGGNVLGRMSGPDWWQFPREQHSYFLGQGETITPIGRDFQSPREAGFGETYRAFTYYLGWHSSQHAGKTMALAGYGDPARMAGYSLFEENADRELGRLTNNPRSPIEMVEWASRADGWPACPPRQQGDPIDQCHRDLARFVQTQIETSVIRTVRRLVAKTGCRNLCLAGGVALNCVMNQVVLEQAGIDEIYVPPAAGDQGQCIGNALYGANLMGLGRTGPADVGPYLGRSYTVSEPSLAKILGSNMSSIRLRRVQDRSKAAADLVVAGYVVGWFQGRSEFGPRALGNRSILARSTSVDILAKLNRIKHRDTFMPYAPSTLLERAQDYFQLVCPSPYMLLAPKVKRSRASEIPAVVHVDGTARVQTVSAEDNPLFHELIRQVELNTSVPIVLNTSFNRESEPIVETPVDAIQCFLSTKLDALIVEDYALLKPNVLVDG